MRTTNITQRENVLKLRVLQLYHRMLYALLFRAAAVSIFRLFKRKTIKMKATSSSITFVPIYQSTRGYQTPLQCFPEFRRMSFGGSAKNRGI